MALLDPPQALLAHWTFATNAVASAPFPVLPDGCQDLIWMERAGRAPVWFIAPMASVTYFVRQHGPVAYHGYRLRPGTRIDANALIRLARDRGRAGEPEDVLPLLAEHAQADAATQEALDALAQSNSVAKAAAALGVSPRTLSRQVGGRTGYPPVYWRRLARVRQAGLSLLDMGSTPSRGAPRGFSLADLAHAHDFADLAHFSRECRTWFGLSPSALLQHPPMLSLLRESGYGT